MSATIQRYRKGQHLKQTQRLLIEHLRLQGHSTRDIADVVGCSHVTVCNELKRGQYEPLTLWAEWTLRQSRRRWQEWGHPGSSEAGGFIPGSQEGCIVCYKTASFADDPGVTRTAGQSSFSLP